MPFTAQFIFTNQIVDLPCRGCKDILCKAFRQHKDFPSEIWHKAWHQRTDPTARDRPGDVWTCLRLPWPDRRTSSLQPTEAAFAPAVPGSHVGQARMVQPLVSCRRPTHRSLLRRGVPSARSHRMANEFGPLRRHRRCPDALRSSADRDEAGVDARRLGARRNRELRAVSAGGDDRPATPSNM